ncbi:DNA adenine methylase [Altererythrobacter xixiisoli]|uniref:DNA adenine methylase n=1 Tax=Croceibacterium xixiisoli TaxID=1476466 RepID=A0A6I4TSP8_9SPHN|nr:DNA adenine methylase [Croceibacterium xixiisoli]MXO98966.1 DNA adenine methylase [Croceibacterium xixiisoli]
MTGVLSPAPHRPILRWHGGKWLLAPWIISQFGPHRVYVEPFGGAWSVGFRKDRAKAEVWNDLDAELVNLFRVLRNPADAKKLVRALRLTPFARDEFNDAYEMCADPVERARRLMVRSFMGHGSDGASGQYRTGFRANSNRSGGPPAGDWKNLPDGLEVAIARLAGVIIENRPAVAVMAQHDSTATLHFVDPPYLHETRSRACRRADSGGVYRHELSDDQHRELLQFLQTLEGMVILCGYPSDMYDTALAGWTRIERAALADGARPRTEVLWLNAAAAAARPQGDMFPTEIAA